MTFTGLSSYRGHSIRSSVVLRRVRSCGPWLRSWLTPRRTVPDIFLADTDIPAHYYSFPAGAIISLERWFRGVVWATYIARIPAGIQSKTRDITGGLPRVADLFEAT